MRRGLISIACGFGLACVGVAACADLAGLHDYASSGTPSPTSTGAGGIGGSSSSTGGGGEETVGVGGTGGVGGNGGTGGNGAGGEGGTVQGTTPADWRTSLDYVFDFEDLGNLGENTGIQMQPAFTAALASHEAVEVKRGNGSLRVVAAAASGDPPGKLMFSTVGAIIPEPLTVGLWIRPEATSLGNATVLGRRHVSNANGFGVVHDAPGNKGSFVAGDGISSEFASSPDGSTPLNMWSHVTGRLRANGTLQSFIGGGALGTTMLNGPMDISGNAFIIGNLANNSNTVFVGTIDEAFFHSQALDDASIFRIYACGIDGSACVCENGAPQNYVLCGELGNCTGMPPGLPACNAPAPVAL